MRKLFLSISLLLLISTAVSVQAQKGDSQILNRQIAAFYQKSDFEKAIPLGKKVVEIEKSKAKNSETHAISLMNLSLLHKGRRQFLQRQLKTLPKGQNMAEIIETIEKDGEGTENLLRESLKIYEGLQPRLELAESLVKTELAWILHNYFPGSGTNESRERIDEAEKLYTEVLSSQEKLTGTESDQTLKTVLTFGDFYMKWINFEKALPFYERYSATVEKRYGKDHISSVPALRAFAEIYVISDRIDEAKKLVGKISDLTGKEEPLPTTSPRLSIRSRGIADVEVKDFIPLELSKDKRKSFFYGAGAGGFSPMGRVVVRYVFVNVLVDENGNVIEAKVISDTKYKKEVETAALKSKFRPFVYNGTAYKLRGNIYYPYYDR